MLGQYLPIVALAVLAVLFAALSIFASKLLAPRRATKAKLDPYECGVEPVGVGSGSDSGDPNDPNDPGSTDPANSQRHTVKFFLVAMLFIVFDVEIIFLYPWAMSVGALGVFGLVAVLIFSFAVFESFLYLISHGALNWGPAKQAAPSPSVSPHRTAATTVRRVGA